MKKLKNFLLVLIASSIGVLSVSPLVLANTGNPVEFIIPDTTLVVNGQASPGALVSIYDSNTLIGTTVADLKGNFGKEFVALDSGLHTLRVEYVDKSGRKSDPITDVVSLAFQNETSVEYFLPPTLESVPSIVTEGGIVTYRGSSVPGATVLVSIDGGNTVVRPQVDSDGNYSISVGTGGYFIGIHPYSAQAELGNKTSFPTEKQELEVLPVPAEERPDETDAALQPPVIVSPSSPSKVSDSNVLISGTAAPNVQVILYVDGEPFGSTFSNNEGDWSFNFMMNKNEHVITAVSCLDGECSDFSNQLLLQFTGDFGRCSDFKFELREYRFWGLVPGNGINIELSNHNGTPPYEVAIDWGDGLVERFSKSDSNNYKVHHIYRNVGKFNGNVVIRDSSDCQYVRYFSADVEEKTLRVVDVWWVIPLSLLMMFVLIFRFNHHLRLPMGSFRR